MNPAVFLDRDGTINHDVDNLRDIKKLRLLPGAAQAIGQLNKLGFLVIVITNQPVVARGWLTEADVEQINQELNKRLKNQGAKIDGFYYCPHHPNANLKKYRRECDCRKPNIGMVKKAQKDFDIDLRKSFFVGDSTRDILAGKSAGLKTILVSTGYGGKDGVYKVEPDRTANNLKEAVEVIKKWQKK